MPRYHALKYISLKALLLNKALSIHLCNGNNSNADEVVGSFACESRHSVQKEQTVFLIKKVNIMKTVSSKSGF